MNQNTISQLVAQLTAHANENDAALQAYRERAEAAELRAEEAESKIDALRQALSGLGITMGKAIKTHTTAVETTTKAARAVTAPARTSGRANNGGHRVIGNDLTGAHVAALECAEANGGLIWAGELARIMDVTHGPGGYWLGQLHKAGIVRRVRTDPSPSKIKELTGRWLNSRVKFWVLVEA